MIFKRVSLICDSTSVICVAKNPVFYKRMRHLERRHHFLRDHVEKRDIEMGYIDTERQLADIFTKPLNISRFAPLRREGNWCLTSLCFGLKGNLWFILYFVSFFLSVTFSTYPPKLILLHLLY
jgi:hypothetical protein